jgi:putative oxygen-independent coproporphyrinogen III oxidase
MRPTLTSATTEKTAGVYVHFPWCLAKCPYCDFVSYVAPRIEHEKYAASVVRDLRARAGSFEGRRIGSVFFGGGTPSLWAPLQIGIVLDEIRRTFGVNDAAEVTVECNPSSLDDDRARALADVGVNRLSIGVQSLRDDRLRFLGRLHDARGALDAVRAALSTGMRVSADLIFGLPDQTPAEAAAEALELADTGLRHLSAYQLTIEGGTRFGELARRGRLPLANEGAVAESFGAIDEALDSCGLEHYEISNYAARGQEARHNLGYWRGDEYLGLGCGAYGFIRDGADSDAGAFDTRGVRWLNVTAADGYMDATQKVSVGLPRSGDGLCQTCEHLDADTLLRERIMLGLRVAGGFDLKAAGEDLGVIGWTAERAHAVERLVARGRIVRAGSSLRVPRDAWLWTDDTAARLF